MTCCPFWSAIATLSRPILAAGITNKVFKRGWKGLLAGGNGEVFNAMAAAL
jgi:hypothetical protein